jgi:hypothetical protein
MGIAVEAARWILKVCKERGISGRCLSLGKQDVSFDLDRMFHLLAERGIVSIENNELALSPAQIRLYRELDLAGQVLSRKRHFAEKNYVSDLCLFGFMGFESIESLDFSDFEGCDIVYDLNRSDPETAIAQPYDLLLDTGTIEHVFHVPNAMLNIFKMLKVGGHVIHMAPTNNYVDHGFFQFSPTFFHDFYKANGFADVAIYLAQMTTDTNGRPWMLSEYRAGMLDNISSGGFDDKLYETFVVARKTEQSTGDAVPYQGVYTSKLW